MQFFLENLCYEICRDENDDLYKEIALRQWIKMNENLKKDFGDNNRSHEETHNRLDYAIEGIDYIRENMNEQKSEKSQGLGKIPIENRAEEYACRWDKNVFLNNFKKRDRNKGVNIKLKEIYLEEHLPHYVWKRYSTISYDLKSLLSEYIADNYVINNDDNNGKKMLVILGQAGIGKSTLITWIMANFVEKKEYI
ncbi:hypothetical protein IMSAG249_02328 [Lachnospiraceae bacterium]|jgi:hypothetical protein|nr:hypothetical protein IMSAGC009_00367 [Lachnospiraceae bacterium]GFI70499.1 hypothetical protein IMSAG249_02328 [Lachnospiraceae bacterium]